LEWVFMPDGREARLGVSWSAARYRIGMKIRG
jgi:hypothetical protein